MQPDLTAGKYLPAWRGVAALLAATPALLHAGGVPTATQIDAEALEEIVVSARRIGLIGESRAASEGIVLAVQIEARPVLRPGEVLETVPGLVVTQHSGDGKANQYYLRGFNLDHGTDFTTRVDGIPVNMPTHGHGQGYADINFLIPELLEGPLPQGDLLRRRGQLLGCRRSRPHLPEIARCAAGRRHGRRARLLSCASGRLA